MDHATAFVRATSLGSILSLFLLVTIFQTTGTKEAEAQTTLPEMSRLTYNVGHQTLGVNEKGEDVTTTLVKQTDDANTWTRTGGCT